MGVSTLFAQSGNGTNPSDATNYTLGIQFSVSTAGTLTAIWFYSGPWATVLPQNIVLYQANSGISGTLLASQAASWSGPAGSGWVRAPWTTPPVLSPGVNYKACVNQNTNANWYSATGSYWTTGAGSAGLTSGPITAPNNASALPGQDSFHNAASIAYPDGANGGNYWIDPEVTIVTGGGSCDDFFGSGKMLT